MSRIEVGIPVRDGEQHLAECIDSLRSQSLRDFRAVLAIDLSTDGSFEAARRAVAGDARFEIVRHDRRLGWVGNCNFLLEQSQAERFSFLPQDDVVSPRYLEQLLAGVDRDPEAAVVYTDLETFGEVSWVIEQESVRGPRTERVLDFLRFHFNAVGFRGAVRGDLARRIRLDDSCTAGFAADTLWLLDFALAGELVRLPSVAYRKRVHDASMVARWKRWGPEVARDAWIAHCAACASRVAGATWGRESRAELDRALEDRLLQRHAPLWPQVGPPESASEDDVRAWEGSLLADFRRSVAESEPEPG